MTSPSLVDEFADLTDSPAPPSAYEGIVDDVAPNKVYVCTEPGCGVELEYGGKGRPPTKCDEHKRSKTKASGDKPSTPRANTKAAREANEISESWRRSMVKGIALLSMLDPFDGLAIYAGHDEVITQAKGVLESHDKLRAFFVDAKQGGSVLGLVGAVLAIALPIMAHHKLIPASIGGVPVGQALETLPQLLMRVNANVNGAADLITARFEQMQAKAAAEARDRAAKAFDERGPRAA